MMATKFYYEDTAFALPNQQVLHPSDPNENLWCKDCGFTLSEVCYNLLAAMYAAPWTGDEVITNINLFFCKDDDALRCGDCFYQYEWMRISGAFDEEVNDCYTDGSSTGTDISM
ncbi:MAG: hypothetical protein M1827_005495 [Pycnora praestabilis]|nr:MAG: hypothetical protein M1827_005495 [Pycnora praestabilis]